VAPVLAALAKRGWLGPVFAAKTALAVADRWGLRRIALDGPVDASRAEALLAVSDPTAVIATTSWGPSRPEPAFLEAARRLAVPSVSVVDFWSNYRERFLATSGEGLVLPDRVAVMDDRARQEALAAGLPESVLVVAGNPHHEGMLTRFGGWDRAARLRFRESMRIPRNATVVLFASQPIEALYGDTLGYTEHSVVTLVAESLVQVAGWLGHPIQLVVRPHPRGGRLDLPPNRAALGIRTVVEGDPIEWCLAADLVVGMTSALLFDTALLGGRVVSVQPGLQSPDRLPTNRMGLSAPVYDAAGVPDTLYRALARPAQAGPPKALAGLRAAAAGATDRLVELMAIDSPTLTGVA
jgi:hypothetical protein